MCSHDKNYHMEKGKRSELNPFLARQLSDDMSKAKGEAGREFKLARLRITVSFSAKQTNKQTANCGSTKVTFWIIHWIPGALSV